MGWLGYGKYDGDDTASTQMMLVEKAGFKNNIPLANKKYLENTFEWNVGKEKLATLVIATVFYKWDALEKLLTQPRKTKSGSFSFDESSALDYMMAADLFLQHDFPLPVGLKEKSIQALDHLINDGHADEFDNPAARKKVLKNFLNKLELATESSPNNLVLTVKNETKKTTALGQTPKTKKIKS